jgi:hypothetical protein
MLKRTSDILFRALKLFVEFSVVFFIGNWFTFHRLPTVNEFTCAAIGATIWEIVFPPKLHKANTTIEKAYQKIADGATAPTISDAVAKLLEEAKTTEALQTYRSENHVSRTEARRVIDLAFAYMYFDCPVPHVDPEIVERIQEGNSLRATYAYRISSLLSFDDAMTAIYLVKAKLDAGRSQEVFMSAEHDETPTVSQAVTNYSS